jgi:rare lipoprotein A
MNLKFLKQPILFILTSLLALLPLMSVKPAMAQGSEIVPEVSSRVWQSDTQEFGSVCLNGKELIAFKSQLGDGVAAEKADELAIKLTDFLNDKSFDPDYLMPGKQGGMSLLKVSNGCGLTFDPSGAIGAPLDISFRIANAIRIACNSQPLPGYLLKVADKMDQQLGTSGSAANTATFATAVGGAPSSFSGRASWYGGRFHGRRTSDGSRYDQEELTAAHRSLPFGTRLLVMNRKTGQACVVRVNDRGPFVANRVIDLSRGAARELNMLSSGVTMVDCLVLGPGGQVH